jgi:mRNA interferase MazF
LVAVDFSPGVGHEQQGYRRAIVLTEAAFNGKTGLCVVCPTTNQSKGYPFEVAIPPGLNVIGVILVDQVKTIDWQARQMTFKCKCPPATLIQVQQKLQQLLL